MDQEFRLLRCSPVLPYPAALPPKKGERTLVSDAGRGDDILLYGLIIQGNFKRIWEIDHHRL
jgi:hypothetical protein